MLCDACDLGYHLECCVPALENVPRGRWYCSTCANAGKLTLYDVILEIVQIIIYGEDKQDLHSGSYEFFCY